MKKTWFNLAGAVNGALALMFHIQLVDRAVPDPHRSAMHP